MTDQPQDRRRFVAYTLRIEHGDDWWELGPDVVSMALNRATERHRFAATLSSLPETCPPLDHPLRVVVGWGPDNVWAGQARVMEHQIGPDGLHTLETEGTFERVLT